MKPASGFFFLLWVLLPLQGVLGCGGSNRQLQSLSISPPSATAQNGQAQFTATGQFTASPTTVTPAAVAWLQEPPIFDPPGDPITFTLTSQPFTARCLSFPSGTVITVIACAPADAARAMGSIPLRIFIDLVLTRTTNQEDGFVAATAQMTCP
jgi:hypothetical protein